MDTCNPMMTQITQFLQELRTTGLSPAAQEACVQDIGEWCVFVRELGRPCWSQVTPADLQSYLHNLNDRGLPVRSVERRLSALRRFRDFLAEHQIIPASLWPADPGTASSSQILSQSDLKALLSGLAETGPDYMDEMLEQFYHHLGVER